MKEIAIKTERLFRNYGQVQALKGVSFHVQEGEVFGYLGPNGSGKTTTIRILTTLIPPTNGYAEVFGQSVESDPLSIRKMIGLVQQQLSCETYLTVFDNLWLYGYLRGLPKHEAKSKSKELITLFGLTEHVNKKAVQLSFGLRRRLQIAREFIHDPPLLFLDEPTIGLDPEVKRLTLELVRKKTEQGMTIFFTTHNMSEAEYLCDRIAILNSGQVLVCGTPEDIMAKTNEKNLEEAYLKIVKADGKQ